MKKLFYKVFFFILIVVLANSTLLVRNSFSQWVQMGGPYRGDIIKLYLTGNEIYAGTYSGGIFRSTNFGNYWFPVNKGLILSVSDIKYLYKNGNRLFASLNHRGIYYTSDSGRNWYQSISGLTSLYVNSICANGTEDLYAGTNNGIFYSSNNGDNWNHFGFQYKIVKCFLILGNRFYVGTQDNGIYLSTNSGLNWITVNNGLPNTSIQTLAVNGTKIFAGIGENTIYYSSNYGANWYNVFYHSSGSFQNAISIVSSGSYMYSIADVGLVRSSDYGSNWYRIEGITGYHFIWDVCTKDSSVWVGTDRCIYKSTNYGNNWINIKNGITNELVICFTSKDSFLFAGTEGYGLHRSTNGGLNWEFYGLFDKSIYALTTCGSAIFAGTVLDGGVYRSTDDGQNWTLVSNGLTNDVVMRFTTKGNYIFAGTFNGVYRSSNLGVNWVGVNSSMQHYEIYALATSDSNIYAGVGYNPGGIYMSSNNGDNWISLNNSGLTNKFIRSILIDGNNIYVGTFEGVFRSTNRGENWSSIGLTTCTTYVMAKYDKYIIAGTNKGVYMFNCVYEKWKTKNEGFVDYTWVYTFKIWNNYLLAGTLYQSVWRRPLPNIVGIEPKEEYILKDYSLSQNYPNPFNPNTNIRFQIKDSRFVVLKIYNNLGKEIAVLVNEKLQRGEYEVNWDASKYPSGIYFYKITTGDYTETKKMVLIK